MICLGKHHDFTKPMSQNVKPNSKCKTKVSVSHNKNNLKWSEVNIKAVKHTSVTVAIAAIAVSLALTVATVAISLALVVTAAAVSLALAVSVQTQRRKTLLLPY